MILSQEQWMELRAFKALADAGATWAEIARETGDDWRTVKGYLSADAGSSPPAPAKRGPGPRKTDPYVHLIDAWLRAQPKLEASVIWERLVAEHGFTGRAICVPFTVVSTGLKRTATDNMTAAVTGAISCCR
jgi:transposase